MSSTKDLNDPLESAKIEAPITKAQAKRRAIPMPPVEPSPVKEPPPAVPVVEEKVERYEVQNQITISWGAQELRLRPGTIVSEATHGPGAIARMQNAGVSLKLIERK